MEDKIMEILKGIDEGIILYNGDNLFDDGILDSIQAVNIVAELEDSLNIEIDAEYVIEDNFRNKDTIIAMVKKIVGE